jgi:hypothetical protein
LCEKCFLGMSSLSAVNFHGLLGHLTWAYAIISFGVTSKQKYSSIDHAQFMNWK